MVVADLTAIRAEAARVSPVVTLQMIVLWPLVALGYTARLTCRVLGAMAAWSFAAVRVGWRTGGPR